MAIKSKRTSLKDIALRAGVSTSLVSFVLNGKQQQYRVNKDVAERVRQIAAEMNYKPNTAAKALRNGRSATIGVVVSDISNRFFAHLARYIESAAEKLGYTVQFSSSDENAERMEILVENMLNRGVDCIILVPCEGSESVIRSLVEREVPLVLLDRFFPEIDTNYVCLNNRKAAYEATRHLIDEGFKKIGFVGYKVQLYHMSERMAGYKSAMSDAGLEQYIHVEYVRHNDMSHRCDVAIDKLMSGGVEAAVFASNAISVECLFAVNRRGITVPDNLAIVGFDGENAFDLFYSPLTYVSQPLEIMAQKAVEIIVGQIQSEHTIMQHVQAEGTLVVRSSSLGKSRKKSGTR